MSGKAALTAAVALLFAGYVALDLLGPTTAAILAVPAAGAIAVGLVIGRRRR